MNSTPNLLAKRVSGIFPTTHLGSGSILHYGKNNTNYFTLTGFMDPLTSMIKI